MASTIGIMFFESRNGTRSFGWSESHVIIGGDALPAAAAKFGPLVEARANLLGAGATLVEARVSKSDEFRDSVLLDPPPYNGVVIFQGYGKPPVVKPIVPGKPGAATPLQGLPLHNIALSTGVLDSQIGDLIVDQPNVGYLVRLQAGAPFVSRRELCLRGMPDGVVKTTSSGPNVMNGQMSVQWLKAFDDWKIQMTAGGRFGMLALNRNAGNKTAITAWTVAGVGNVVTATIPLPFGAIVGDKVQVRGVKIQQGPTSIVNYSETLTVDTVDPVLHTYTFIGSKKVSPFYNNDTFKGASFADKGTAQKNVTAELPYLKVVGEVWGDRKTGAPFDRPHGRAKIHK